MPTVVGGLRHRLIKDSLYLMLNRALTDLGWFAPGRVNLPIQFKTIPFEPDVEIPLNTAVLSTEDWVDVGGELGSNMGEFSWTTYLDFYAESDAVGQHLIGDVYEIVAGRMSSIGRGRTTFPVFDLRQATPPVLFYADLEEPIIDRAHDFPKTYQRHWFACRFFVVDAYVDDNAEELQQYVDSYGDQYA